MRIHIFPTAFAMAGLVGGLAAVQVAAAETLHPGGGGLDTEPLEERLTDLAGLTSGSVMVEVLGRRRVHRGRPQRLL